MFTNDVGSFHLWLKSYNQTPISRSFYFDYVPRKPTHATSCHRMVLHCADADANISYGNFRSLNPGEFQINWSQEIGKSISKIDKAGLVIHRQPEISSGIRSFIVSCHYGNYQILFLPSTPEMLL